MKKFITVLLSLASALLISTPAWSDEDAPSWVDGFTLGGYSSAQFALERNGDASASLNEISMLLSWNSDSRWHFFSELELENPITWNDEKQFHAKSVEIDLERFYFDYNVSEKANIRLGRFLTPNSRWNLLHAPPLVWTTTRPLATTRLFPMETNGVMLFGALPFLDGAFEYKVFSEVLEDQKMDNNELAFEHVYGARVSLKNQSDVGLSFLSFKEKNIPNGQYTMLGLDFVTHVYNVEVSGEAFHRLTSTDNDGGSGAYLQTAVPLNNMGLNNWYWITRLETFQRPDEGASERWLLGATWRVKPQQLFKLEFTGGSGDQPDAPRGFLTSFTLFF